MSYDRGGGGFNKSTSIVARSRRQTAEDTGKREIPVQHRLSRFPLRPPDRSLVRACLVGLFSFLAWIEACDPVEGWL